MKQLKNRFKSFWSAIPWVGNFELVRGRQQFRTQQQVQPCLVHRRADAQQIPVIRTVHGKHPIEGVKIIHPHLSGMACQIQSVLGCVGTGARVGQFSPVLAAGTCTVYAEMHACSGFFGVVQEKSFCQRRSADIAQADKENRDRFFYIHPISVRVWPRVLQPRREAQDWTKTARISSARRVIAERFIQGERKFCSSDCQGRLSFLRKSFSSASMGSMMEMVLARKYGSDTI